MTHKTQIALGKNTTLQRQLEEKYVEFRRNLKCTKRRLDMLEEECLSMLYKTIIDESGKSEEEKQTSNDNTSKTPKAAEPKRAKSAGAKLWKGQSCVPGPPLKLPATPEPTTRSTTSMSVRDYKKSYSFQTDGMNIDRSRRDRYMRSKKQKAEKEIEIRRGNVHWATKDDYEDERPMTSLQSVEDSREREDKEVRPYTADPYQARNHEARLLQRSKLQQSLRSGTTTSATEVNTKHSLHDSEAGTNSSVTGKNSLENTPTQMSVADRRATSKNTQHISFNASVTELDDMRGPTPNNQDHSEQSRHFADTEEEELIPLGEDDQLHLDTIMGDTDEDYHESIDGSTSRLAMSSQATSRKSRNRSRQGKSTDLTELATETQTFLTSYAKKSKLLGYVVKARESAAAPRDRNKKTYRSHCVTYQELVSIKANIKQQESRTRLLLQRSAKLTKYVDHLAHAGNIRRYRLGLNTM